MSRTGTPRYATDNLKSCDPNDPNGWDTSDLMLWELVAQYRRICREKTALQEEILCQLGERGHGHEGVGRGGGGGTESDVEIEMARVVLAAATAAVRHGTMGAVDRTWARSNHGPGEGQGELPAITDLDGPREDLVRSGDLASRGASSDRVAVSVSMDTSSLPPHAPSPAIPLPTLQASMSPAVLAPAALDVGPPRLPADGSVFRKYNEMIAALRTRSPPITLSFLPREEIPWPLLPSPSAPAPADAADADGGVFPVAVSKASQIELEEVAEFVTGYALWREKPLGKTLNILLGHWISMDKRLRGASKRMCVGQDTLEVEVSTEVSETLSWIATVRSKLYAIVAEQDPEVFTIYEQLMASLARGGYQLLPAQAIPWPIIPGLGEHYPVPAPGRGIRHRQIGRFVRAYSTWKTCSKADMCARMLSEWEALHRSCIASDARTQKCIKGVANYLAGQCMMN